MADCCAQSDKIQTAVVTGRHPYDVRGFYRAFASMPDIDAYIQHMEDFISDPGRASYDVVVFYNFHQETPGAESNWWDQNMLPALSALGETKQGILVMHHAILAFPGWDYWADLVGITDRKFGYHIGEQLTIDIADPDHPITGGLSSWTMTDETYDMASAGEGCHVLLTTDHPKSMKTIAWTRQHRESPVLCLESGHDDATYSDESFREVLARGIRWLAGRLS
jgi:uncharacterized protein